MLWCQTDLDYSYSLSNCWCNGNYDCDLCGDEVYGEFSVKPIVVYMHGVREAEQPQVSVAASL